jgi:predicted alpha/beta superfamily hydrolase
MKRATTSPNVHIIDEAFFMSRLHRYRRIWIYLPHNYKSTEKEYPVLYMHDGQNLFEEWSAFTTEWQVDETLDELKGECIVVGIDNGGEHRLTEYNWYDHPEFGKGEGKVYLHFIIHELKPYIDRTFRTVTHRTHTWIAGSSMGALISLYALMYHHAIFGGGGIFSPSLQMNQDIVTESKAVFAKQREKQRIYLYAGGKESDEMIEKLSALRSILGATGGHQVVAAINEEGTHSEENWRAIFKKFYEWMIEVVSSE